MERVRYGFASCDNYRIMLTFVLSTQQQTDRRLVFPTEELEVFYFEITRCYVVVSAEPVEVNTETRVKPIGSAAVADRTRTKHGPGRI